MARVLFVVARERAELLGHLAHEFPEGDVSVVMDRREAERRETRRRTRTGAASSERRGTDRRGTDRREVHASARELQSIGYSIVHLEDSLSVAAPSRPLVNPTAVRQAESYLRDHFRYYTAVASWDRMRDGQAFVILSAEGRVVHRVVFTQEFLSYYGVTMPDRIPKLLDEWRLPQWLDLAGTQPVVVSSYGVRLDDD